MEEKRTTSEYAIRKEIILKKLKDSGQVCINGFDISPADLKKFENFERLS